MKNVKAVSLSVGAMVLLILADQAVKLEVRRNVPLGQRTVLVPNLLELTHTRNDGVSFGFLAELPGWLLVGISVAAILVLAFFWVTRRKSLNRMSHLAFLLILPGAIGNLIDRALFGAVTDYLHFRFYSTSFFVNNLADMLISAGVVAFLIGAMRGERSRAAHHRAARTLSQGRDWTSQRRAATPGDTTSVESL